MSHVIDAKLKVRDLDCLDEALAEHLPHLELRRDRTEQCWWGTFVGDSTPPEGLDPKDYGKCKHTIGRRGKVPSNGPNGEWEIGLVPAADGDGYRLVLDSYGSSGAVLARELPALRREYAAAVQMKQARAMARQGWRTERETLPGNRIRLRVRRR